MSSQANMKNREKTQARQSERLNPCGKVNAGDITVKIQKRASAHFALALPKLSFEVMGYRKYTIRGRSAAYDAHRTRTSLSMWKSPAEKLPI